LAANSVKFEYYKIFTGNHSKTKTRNELQNETRLDYLRFPPTE